SGIWRLELGPLKALRCAHRLNTHGDQSLTLILIHPNSKCHVPWGRRKFCRRAIKINRATVSVTLTQPKDEMFFVCDSRRRDRFDGARKKNRLRISTSEWLQQFVPAQKLHIDVRERQLMIEPQT